MRTLPAPSFDDAESWTRTHLGDLAGDEVQASPSFRGGQQAADAALANFDVAGYASRRNTVLPASARGASRLSPYIRHGLLPLQRVWRAVAGGPSADVSKFRDELLWQEYARHLHARTEGLRSALRYDVRARGGGTPGWDDMACLAAVSDELERDGWMVNQARMWAASHWTVRHQLGWRDGEDHFFRHLLDGSRAANRLGWQWTSGAGTGRPYGFARAQVERRAPGLCASCTLRDACPIEQYADDPALTQVDAIDGVRSDPDPERTAGPREPVTTDDPDVVWITAESLGDDDPALTAHPTLPVVFVFDEPLLQRLRLSGKRLVFLVESLADLAQRRDISVLRGEPIALLRERFVATTFTPVPGWRARSQAIAPVAIHPWPWLVRPHAGPAGSFTAWSKRARLP